MKKIFLTLLIIIAGSLAAFADILPLSSSSIKNYGVGVINMPKTFKIYQYPYLDAKVVREVTYDGLKRSAIVNSVDMRNVSYIAFVPSSGVALLSVDDISENGWYRVFINQKTGETGWVKEDDETAFMTYKDLFYKYGKKYGIRMFSDLNENEKSLRSGENDDAQILAKLTYPKSVSFTVIHGNKMLVSVLEMNDHEKIGWFTWRNDDGTLNAFPEFRYK